MIRLAAHISRWSKDPSTRCGAVLFKNKRIVSLGYNGYPQKCLDDDFSREYKYTKIIHAEMNAILFAPDCTGCTLAVWPFLTCDRCAVHVIQAGVVRVVTVRNDNERWAESFDRARKFYAEAGVEVIEYESISL